jgi:ubiquinone/menaquinone biosynthesis C-methylase UbiE
MITEAQRILNELGAKPSTSEENGLALIRPCDLTVFSPGISTGGFAEIRMALANPDRTVVATTIDQKGLDYARKNITELGLNEQIQTKIEDLTNEHPYPDEYFDFIYARLVLHYLSYQELDKVLGEFRRTLKQSGQLFIVVRSEKNIDISQGLKYNPETRITTETYIDAANNVVGYGSRYFHSHDTINDHLKRAGFEIGYWHEYEEQLFKDFMRTQPAAKKDNVIEVLAR